ncbi:MAG TPA: hypothetical protein VH061_14990 [Solirubrobacteraceae bacterium]|nr:hypothetical protein [Solirubrobacteraceae bacterium]
MFLERAQRVCGEAGNQLKGEGAGMGRLTLRAVGAGAVALLAALVAVVPVASASLPELGRCVATESGTRGRYSDNACIVRAHRAHGEFSGGYEWHPAEEQTNAQPEGLEGQLTFETASGARVECASNNPFDQSELIGTKTTLTPLWTLLECSSEGQECHSAVSVNDGEITNSEVWDEVPFEEGQPAPGWSGKLGFVSRGVSPVVGIAYLVKNHERAYPPISCGGAIGTIWIGGDPKGANTFTTTIGPVDEMTTAFTEAFSESAPGVVSPAKVSGSRKASFMAFREDKWEPVAMIGSWHEPVEEGELSLEIKALR